MDYLADQKTMCVPVSRHTRRLIRAGHTCGSADLRVYNDVLKWSNDYGRANFVVLQHHNVVRPYVAMHKTKLKSEEPKKGEALLVKEHNTKFTEWLKNYWYGRNSENEEEEMVFMLSQEPLLKVVTFQA